MKTIRKRDKLGKSFLYLIQNSEFNIGCLYIDFSCQENRLDKVGEPLIWATTTLLDNVRRTQHIEMTSHLKSDLCNKKNKICWLQKTLSTMSMNNETHK